MDRNSEIQQQELSELPLLERYNKIRQILLSDVAEIDDIINQPNEIRNSVHDSLIGIETEFSNVTHSDETTSNTQEVKVSLERSPMPELSIHYSSDNEFAPFNEISSSDSSIDGSQVAK